MQDDEIVSYGPPAALPRLPEMRRSPRPPLPVPHVASRSVPLPKAMPPRAVAEPKGEFKPLAAQPAPARQSAAAKPDTPAAASAAAAATAAVPAPAPEAKLATPLPSQAMPPVQGLE
jgi:hypothetical protein